jgi:hypothetical protein
VSVFTSWAALTVARAGVIACRCDLQAYLVRGKKKALRSLYIYIYIYLYHILYTLNDPENVHFYELVLYFIVSEQY